MSALNKDMLKSRGPHIDSGLCRFCGKMKRCRILNFEYKCGGQKEIYAEMLFDCFGLALSHLDGEQKDRLVCATCVTRLREACNFKKQVSLCEEAFMQWKMYDAQVSDNPDLNTFTEDTKFNVDIVKMEVDDKSETGSADRELPTDLNEGTHDSNSDDLPVSQLKASLTNTNTDNLKKRNHHNYMMAPKDGQIRKGLPMKKLQKKIRLQDPSYIRETNIMTIIEYSYVCPFKCKHNHILCYYCGSKFPEPDILRRHTLETHQPSMFKIRFQKMIKVDITRIDCRLCDATIDNLDEFKRHITSTHNKEYYFKSKEALLPFKLTSGDVKCALCDDTFPYFHALNVHMNLHYNNFVCETCGLGFVDKNRFDMHQQKHYEGDMPCHICGKVFKGHHNRELHIDRVHNKLGRIYCPKCDVRLMTYPQKLKHLIKVHGERPMSFPCSRCSRVCDTRRSLTIHQRKEHLKDYRYNCEYCGHRFFTKFALTNHMPTHTQERNFKCKVCEKSYPRLKTLKDHMRIHTNDRRYRCHVCGQAFIQNCSLKGHMKSQHPEYG